MRASAHAANPFEMLVNPEAILHAVEASSPLQSLRRRLYRPLDQAARPSADTSETVASFDAAVDGVLDNEVY